jgi:AcrR family transcriptional regulator
MPWLRAADRLGCGGGEAAHGNTCRKQLRGNGRLHGENSCRIFTCVLTYPWVRYQVPARVVNQASSYAMSKTAVATSPHRKAFANRRRDPETKREAVLQIAAQLFLEKSYGRTSMNDVAERLHITKPALYHYFHNKEEILLECYRLGSALIEEILNDISAQCGTGLAKVAAFIYSYANVMTVNFGRCVMRMDEGDLSDDAFGEVRNYKRKIDRRLRAFIQEGIADGSITPCDPKIAAFSIAGALNWMCIWYEPEGPLPAEEIAQQFARTLTQGLATRRRRNGSRAKSTQESSK